MGEGIERRGGERGEKSTSNFQIRCIAPMIEENRNNKKTGGSGGVEVGGGDDYH